MPVTCERHPARTALAWQAMARPDVLGRRTHALLLLANGRRSLPELRRLLGEDPGELVERLCAQGFLQDTARAQVAEADDDLPGA